MKDLRRPDGKVIAPLKAIRKHCIECMGGSTLEVEKCTAPKCWLFPFRMGKDPRREKRELSEKEKSDLTRRLRQSPKE